MTPAWMNHPVPGKWTTPDVDQAAKNLTTLGAKALVFVPIGFVTENHETQLDIGYTIDKVGDAGRVCPSPDAQRRPCAVADGRRLDQAAHRGLAGVIGSRPSSHSALSDRGDHLSGP